MQVSSAADGRTLNTFASELATLKARVAAMENGLTTGQLGNSSVENKAITFYDSNGTARAQLGLQDDGTFVGGNSINNDTPPQRPAAPTVVPVLGGLRVTSNGPESGTWPTDFDHLNVYVRNVTTSETRLMGTIVAEPGTITVAPLAYDTSWLVWLSSVNQSGYESAAGATATGTPSRAVAQDILDGAINDLKLANNAVTQAKIATAAVGTAQIQGQAVDLSKLADGSVSAAQLVSGAVTTPKIATAAVVSDLIAAGAVIAGKIDANAVTAATIAAGAVLADKIAASAISADKIAANAVTAEKILALAITSDKIAANSITSSMIQAGAITAASLEADMVLAKRIIIGAINGARVVLDPITGMNLYNAAGTRTGWWDAATGNILIIGELYTGSSGQRVQALQNGTLRFYPTTGTNFSEIANSSGNIVMRGPTTTGTSAGSAGYVTMDGATSQIAYGPTNNASASTSKWALSDRTIASTAPVVSMFMDRRITTADASIYRIDFQTINSDSAIEPTAQLRYTTALDDYAKWHAVNNNVGLVFADGILKVIMDNEDYNDIKASAFTTSCELAAKTNVVDIATGTGAPAKDIVRKARSVEWEYVPGYAHAFRERKAGKKLPNNPRKWKVGSVIERTVDKISQPDGTVTEHVNEVKVRPPRQRKQYGPTADDVEKVAPNMVHIDPQDGSKGLNIGDVAGMAWAAAGEAHDDIDELRAEIKALREELAALRSEKS